MRRRGRQTAGPHPRAPEPARYKSNAQRGEPRRLEKCTHRPLLHSATEAQAEPGRTLSAPTGTQASGASSSGVRERWCWFNRRSPKPTTLQGVSLPAHWPHLHQDVTALAGGVAKAIHPLLGRIGRLVGGLRSLARGRKLQQVHTQGPMIDLQLVNNAEIRSCELDRALQGSPPLPKAYLLEADRCRKSCRATCSTALPAATEQLQQLLGLLSLYSC